jgi:hypothetical protein
MKTPDMHLGHVEMVSVEWILQNVTHSVDGHSNHQGLNCITMIKDKGSDCHFGDICATILSDGFRIPIVLDLSYSGEDTVTLGNGHHRMSAAILLCLDSIPVFWADSDYMSENESEGDDIEDFPEWNDVPAEVWAMSF